LKLIVATLQDQDRDSVIEAATKQGFRVTRIGSTGGFLAQGNTTLLMGVDDHKVDAAVSVFKNNSQRRRRFIPMATGAAPDGVALYNYIEVEVGGATIFILNVEHFEQV
jgi:uncharacterized protein YaaQ